MIFIFQIILSHIFCKATCNFMWWRIIRKCVDLTHYAERQVYCAKITLTTLEYLGLHHGDRRVFSILNNNKCLS